MTFEYFPTPSNVVIDLLNLDFMEDYMTVLEPCAGQGAIVSKVMECYPTSNITAVEIYQGFQHDIKAETVIIDNFFNINWSDKKFDRIIINPPFSHTAKFIQHCYQLLKQCGRMAVFMPLSQLTGIERYNTTYSVLPPDEIHILVRRPKFETDGKRYATITANNISQNGHCWAIWDNPISNETMMKWIRP